MSNRVTVSISDGIADVRFNRADKRNALDGEQFAAIVDAGERLKGDASVRAVVVSGEGASFCAGLDFSMFGNMAERSSDEPSVDIGAMAEGRITHLGQQACWVWQEIEAPVIMAVHGHAIGGGFQIAMGGDIRVAHPDTKWSVREVHWGLVPDMTGTFVLSKLVRNDIAKELAMTGRIIDGAEANRIGLVTRESDTPRETAFELAREIAGRSPQAVRGVKALMNNMYAQDAAGQFALERETIGSLIGSPDQVESITANLENRAPNFVG